MRSGAGCVLDDAELVGGDLPVIVGGGGITLDRDDADECFNRCEENPRCTWYTYDTRYMSSIWKCSKLHILRMLVILSGRTCVI